jgi:hypothetical protein
MSRFSKLSSEIESTGKSKKSADAIAASIGRKKYGKTRMSKMAATARRKNNS